MRKFLLFASFLAIPFFGSAQAFQENFDGSGPGFAAWTVIDNDGLPANAAVADIVGWVRKDRGGATPNYGGPDNDFAAVSTSWYTPAGTSDDWLITPQIAVPAGVTSFKWDAKAQDADFPDGYKLMLSPNGGNTIADFTVELYNTAAEDAAWVTREVNTSAYAGTTVRFAFVNNSNDMFVLLVDNISLGAFTPSYCTASATSTSWEKITNVTLADINNNSSATAGYEDFTSITGNVTAGQTYNFTASFTGTSFDEDHVLVWIDLNQDLDFDDAGEQVLVTPAQQSPWTGTITIPSTASAGTTRMRVRLNDSGSTTSNTTPCGTATFGQVEDYTLNITTLAVNDAAKNTIKVYPNPVVDVLNIESPSKVKSVTVFDASGKSVSTHVLNASKSQINLSRLTSGAYIVNIEMENETKTIKMIKK